MKILYNIAVSLFPVGAYVGSLFSKKMRLFYNGRKKLLEKMKREYSEKGVQEDAVVWFHCSSVGEFEQARPVIERYHNQNPQAKILLTFFSPSGYELRKKYPLAEWVYYLPYDTPSNAREFIKIFRPQKVVFTKYDLWYNVIDQAKKSGAELYLISAIFRKEQIYFKSYAGFFRSMLNKFDTIFLQDGASEDLLKSHGITASIEVCGDTRFDRVAEVASEAENPVVESFSKSGFTIVAGSTWLPDEELIAGVLKNFSKVKLVIAPHEVQQEKIERVERLFESYGVVRYTDILEKKKNMVGESVLIIDTVGILSALYKYADFAYIGGGFGAGIHNTLEAAVYGCPLVFGPNYTKFKEATDLLNLGAAKVIREESDLYRIIADYIKDRNLLNSAGRMAKSYVEENVGATEKIVKELER